MLFILTSDGVPSVAAHIMVGVNTAPVAVDDSYSTEEDTPLTVPAPGVLDNDDDAEDDTLTAVLVSGPSNAASFTLNADGSFNYTPTADFNGTDSFTYKANDGAFDSNEATVTITVDPVNDEPTVQVAEGSCDALLVPLRFGGSGQLAPVAAVPWSAALRA